MPDTLKSLRAEVESLRAELAELRAWRDNHLCATPAPVAQQCTCATSGSSAYCPVHTPSNMTIRYWPTMGAAGCAAGNFTYTVPATTTVQSWQLPAGACIGGAAGGAPVYLQNYAVGGECA